MADAVDKEGFPIEEEPKTEVKRGRGRPPKNGGPPKSSGEPELTLVEAKDTMAALYDLLGIVMGVDYRPTQDEADIDSNRLQKFGRLLPAVRKGARLVGGALWILGFSTRVKSFWAARVARQEAKKDQARAEADNGNPYTPGT